jgi:hypothetical protein
MNLIYSTTIQDTYSVYVECVYKDGQPTTIYYAECDGWSSGMYVIKPANTYCAALRILASLK